MSCLGEEFVINTREDIDNLDSATCKGHRWALKEVLFDMTLTKLADAGSPAVSWVKGDTNVVDPQVVRDRAS